MVYYLHRILYSYSQETHLEKIHSLYIDMDFVCAACVYLDVVVIPK